MTRPGDTAWFRLATAGLAIHALDHWRTGRHPARLAELAGLAVLDGVLARVPPARRDALVVLLGLGPTYGAFAGHLVPLARGERRPATGTAAFNLAGGVLLLALGLRPAVRSRRGSRRRVV